MKTVKPVPKAMFIRDDDFRQGFGLGLVTGLCIASVFVVALMGFISR